MECCVFGFHRHIEPILMALSFGEWHIPQCHDSNSPQNRSRGIINARLKLGNYPATALGSDANLALCVISHQYFTQNSIPLSILLRISTGIPLRIPGSEQDLYEASCS